LGLHLREKTQGRKRVVDIRKRKSHEWNQGPTDSIPKKNMLANAKLLAGEKRRGLKKVIGGDEKSAPPSSTSSH